MDVPEAIDDRAPAPSGRADQERLLQLLRGQKDVFEEIARAAPLPAILEKLVRLVEEQSDTGAMASVLLLDEDGLHLRHGAAPSLPAAYNAAIDGVAIGPAAGSCGTAAHRRAPVIVADIGTDPLWADFRELAAGAGLRACWSVPIMASTGALLGTFAVYHATPGAPDERDQSLLDAFQQAAALAIERDRDFGELLRAKRRAEALHDVGQAIASRLDLEEIVQLATDSATELTGADFGAFFSNASTGQSQTYMLHALSGASREVFDRFPIPRGAAPASAGVGGAGTVRIADLLAESRFEARGAGDRLPLRSYLEVPVITSDGAVAGGMLFGHAEPGVFDAEAERLVLGIASQASIAIENAGLYADAQRQIEARERAFADRDRVARVLQESLLPSALPEVPAVELAARYKACTDGIGGDFYDVFPLPDGRWGLVVGDVCGKGAEAAARTALARHTVRTAAMLDPRPAEVLHVLNEALLEQDPTGTRFCTAIFGVLAIIEGGARLTLARAGHPPALIARPSGVTSLPGGGRVLGAFTDTLLHDEVIELAPGESLVLHTDGLTDVGRESDVLGTDWVLATLMQHRAAGAAIIADRLADGAVALQSSAAGRDDIAVLALTVSAARP